MPNRSPCRPTVSGWQGSGRAGARHSPAAHGGKRPMPASRPLRPGGPPRHAAARPAPRFRRMRCACPVGHPVGGNQADPRQTVGQRNDPAVQAAADHAPAGGDQGADIPQLQRPDDAQHTGRQPSLHIFVEPRIIVPGRCRCKKARFPNGSRRRRATNLGPARPGWRRRRNRR